MQTAIQKFLLALFLVCLPACTGAFALTVHATADDFLFLSVRGEDYTRGANWDNWHLADQFALALAPGEEHSLVFFTHNHFGPNSPFNPGGFLAQLDLESGWAWSGLGEGSLRTDLSHWEYSLTDPLLGSADWLDPASGWESERARTAGPQVNGPASMWGRTNGGAVDGVAEDALWLWSDANFAQGAPDNLWWHLKQEAQVVPAVAEPRTSLLLLAGLAGLALALARRPGA